MLSALHVAERSVELLCKGMQVELLRKAFDLPLLRRGAVREGDRIEVTCRLHVNDWNRANPTEYHDEFVLPLVCLGHNHAGEPVFRVPQEIVSCEVVDEKLMVCWGDPAIDGYQVWFYSTADLDGGWWTTCSDYEDSEPLDVRMAYDHASMSKNGSSPPLHPELEPAVA